MFVAAHMINQLKDQRVEVSERLRLAQLLWKSKDGVGPNKQQVVVDCVTAMLIQHKKRLASFAAFLFNQFYSMFQSKWQICQSFVDNSR
jgi:hypothetical protein